MKVDLRGIILVSLCLTFALLTSSAAAAPNWSRTYEAPPFSVGRAIHPTTDGGFVIVGNAPGGDVLWVTKTDGSGNILWQRTYAVAVAFTQGPNAAATGDGGVIVSGRVNGQLSLLKLSSAGAVDWHRVYDGGWATSLGSGIVQTADGGYFALGATGPSDGFVIRVDASGTLAWATELANAPVYLISAAETADGGVVVVGSTIDEGIIVKLSSTGVVEWDNDYEIGPNQNILIGLELLADGDVAVAGYADLLGDRVYDAWIMRVNPDGTVEWSRTVGGTRSDQTFSVVETASGDLVAAGTTSSFGSGPSDAMLIALQGNGQSAWQKAYGNVGQESFQDIDVTSGDLVAAGIEEAFDAIGSQVWVVRTDAAGSLPLPCDLESVITPTITSGSPIVTSANLLDSTPGITVTSPAAPVTSTSGQYSEQCPCTTCVRDIHENDDSCRSSSPIRGNETQARTFWDEPDDWVAFNACAGRSYGMTTLNLGASTDTVIDLVDRDCTTQLASDDNGAGGLASTINWVAPADGVYRMRVRQADASAGVDRDYDLSLVGDTSPCSLWSRAVGGTGDDPSAAALTTWNGGLLVAGTTDSSGQGAEDGWLLEVDEAGQLVWERTYGSVGSDRFADLVRVDETRLLLGGEAPGSGDRDAWLMQVDAAGAEQWSRRFDDGGDEWISSVPGTTTAVVNRTFGADPDDHRVLQVTDLGGLDVWTEFVMSSGNRFEAGIAARSGFGGQAILAGSYDEPANGRDVLVHHPSSRIRFGGVFDDEALAMIETSDRGMLVVGYTASFGAGGEDVWVIKFNPHQEVEWDRTYGDTGDERGVDVIETSDGGFAIAATTTSFGVAGTDIWILKLTANGDIQGQRTFGGLLDDSATAIREMIDGGFAVVGTTDSQGAGADDTWIFRVGALGALPGFCADTGGTAISPDGPWVGTPDDVTITFSSDTTGLAAWAPVTLSAASTETLQCDDACTDGDTDGVTACGDCNDGDDRVYPGAAQQCDGVNNDCNDPSWPQIPADEADVDGDLQRICEGDCNDAVAATYSGAAETSDGLDNQCPGEPGFGLIDEISGSSGYIPGSPPMFCWDAQPGAFSYQVARADDEELTTNCTTFLENGTCLADPAIPPMTGGFFYVVRSISPNVGSWGEDSAGIERMFVCGTETNCTDGLDLDGDGLTDCLDPDCAADPSCFVAEFSFVDTANDDLTSTALDSFFAGVPPLAMTDYIYFEAVRLGGNFSWCSTRADWFRVTYLANQLGTASLTSPPGARWHRSPATGNLWTSASPLGYQNHYGLACGELGSWCAEEGIMGPDVAIRPGDVTNCEASQYPVGGGAATTCPFNGGTSIRIAATRLDACGF